MLDRIARAGRTKLLRILQLFKLVNSFLSWPPVSQELHYESSVYVLPWLNEAEIVEGLVEGFHVEKGVTEDEGIAGVGTGDLAEGLLKLTRSWNGYR